MVEKYKFTGILNELVERAENEKASDIDFIFDKLNGNPNFAVTRYVDFALSQVVASEGIEQIRYYLFNGTLIQRNYATLYFNRNGEWQCVKLAFEKGLIDEVQAYSR